MEFVDASLLIPTEPSVVRTSVDYFINLLEENRGNEIPAIKIFKVNDFAVVIDGHNRAYAFIKKRYTNIPCELLSIDTIPAYRQKYFIHFCKHLSLLQNYIGN